jgi:hypothetical protein
MHLLTLNQRLPHSTLTSAHWKIQTFWRTLTLTHSSTRMPMPLDLGLIPAYPIRVMVLRQVLVTACERVKVLTVLPVLHLRYTLVCTFDHCSSAFSRILDLFCFLLSQFIWICVFLRMCCCEIGVGCYLVHRILSYPPPLARPRKPASSNTKGLLGPGLFCIRD